MKQKLTILGEEPKLGTRYRMKNGMECTLIFIEEEYSMLPFEIQFQFPDSPEKEIYWLSNGGIDNMGLSNHTIVEKLGD